MKLLLVAAFAALALAGCSAGTYNFFPPCNAAAEVHHTEWVFQARDAAIVAQAATRDGWTHVVVDDQAWGKARVDGDCLSSKQAEPKRGA